LGQEGGELRKNQETGKFLEHRRENDTLDKVELEKPTAAAIIGEGEPTGEV